MAEYQTVHHANDMDDPQNAEDCPEKFDSYCKDKCGNQCDEFLKQMAQLDDDNYMMED